MNAFRSTFVLTALTVVLVGMIVSACANRGRTLEVTVEVNEAGYQPATVEITAGETANLTLKNTGSVEHQLGITEIPLMTQGGEMAGMAGMDDTMVPEMEQLQVHLVAASGAATSLELTPTKPGEYTFRCVAPGHTEQGTLIVS